MTEDLYRLALATLKRHLEESGVDHSLDDGDLSFGGHRLSLSVSFEQFVEQDGQVIAPVDLQLHVDGDDGGRFRLGALGIGPTRPKALQAAVEEWHLLAAAPVLSALGAQSGGLRREKLTPKLAGWNFFPGRAGVRGTLPAGLQPDGAFHRALLAELHKFVSSWDVPQHFTLRSIFVFYSSAEGKNEVEAAVDGAVDAALTERLQLLEWPREGEAYLYKQLFVFRLGE
jgi:hypothetical protein